MLAARSGFPSARRNPRTAVHAVAPFAAHRREAARSGAADFGEKAPHTSDVSQRSIRDRSMPSVIVRTTARARGDG